MGRNILSIRNLLIIGGLLIVLLTILDSFYQKDSRKLSVVYKLPNMEKAQVQDDLTYKSVDGSDLKMDLYYPPDYNKASRLPAVIIVNGTGVSNFKDLNVYSSWGRLIAASGLIAVTYDTGQSDPMADSGELINYIRNNAATLNIDENRIGLWANSFNVSPALRLAMQEERKYLRCAVFYYGHMRADPIRVDVPLFIVKTGRYSDDVGGSIDNFIRRAEDEGLPITVTNYTEGQQEFDTLDDNDRSREVIKQTLNFITENIAKDFLVKEDPNRAPSPRKFQLIIANEGIEKALEVYERTKKTQPGATLFKENTLNSIGYRLLRNKKRKEAIEIFKLNVAAYPQSPNVYDSLADAYEEEGNKELAIQFSEKALEMLQNSPDMDEDRKENLRRSATQKLKRLKG